MNKLSHLDIENFPKAELHLHLDGALPAEVVIKLAKRSGVILPTYDLVEFKKLYSIVGLEPTELFQRFAWAIGVMRTPEGLEESAYELVLELARQNILYAEVRFAPGYHSIYPPKHFYVPAAYETEPFPVMTLDDAVAAALAGLKRGNEETGIVTNLTLCIPRESLDQYGLESVMAIAKLAVKWQSRGVVSLDLACYEPPYPPSLYFKAFALAASNGLRRNPHAGEMGDFDSRLDYICQALTALKANGLGHAYGLHHDNSIMGLVKERKVRIERHPLGAFSPKLEDSGFDVLLGKEICMCVISDDPALYQQTLAKNLEALLQTYSWGEAKLHQIIANSINSGFYVSLAQKLRVWRLFRSRGLNPRFLHEL